MRKRIRRWTFVQTEVMKNLLMGSKAFQAIRGSRMRHHSPQEALNAATEICRFYEGQLRRLNLPAAFLHEKRVLEIGPGASMIIPIWFLAQGARQAEGIDRFMELLPPPELTALHSLVVKTWPPEMQRRVDDVLSWCAPGKDGDRLTYRNLPIEKALEDLAGSFNIIVSFNVMGNVYDVGAAIRSQHRLLAPGGLMIHRIDCGPAGNVGNFGAGLLNHLTFSPRVWRLMYSNRMGTNRELMSTFVKECELAGFKDIGVEVMRTIPDDEIERLRPRLHHEYRDRSLADLRVNWFALTAIKP